MSAMQIKFKRQCVGFETLTYWALYFGGEILLSTKTKRAAVGAKESIDLGYPVEEIIQDLKEDGQLA